MLSLSLHVKVLEDGYKFLSSYIFVSVDLFLICFDQKLGGLHVMCRARASGYRVHRTAFVCSGCLGV